MLVTHHADEVAALADEVVLLAAGQVTARLKHDDFVARYADDGSACADLMPAAIGGECALPADANRLG